MHVFLLATFLLLPKQDQPNTLGLTEAQILSMGQDKWTALYGKKVGQSTADMVEMNSVFGLAMVHRNDRMLAKAPPAKRQRLLKVRKALDDFASTSIELAYNLTGGGTMWSPVSADIDSQVEEVIFGMLGGTVAHQKKATVAELHHYLALASNAVRETHADTSATYFHFADASRSISRLKAQENVVIGLIKEFPGKNGQHVLNVAVDYARLITEAWG